MRAFRLVTIGAWIVLIVSSGYRLKAGDSTRPSIDSRVAAIEFQDTRYLRRSLGDLGSPRATVIVAVNSKCPLVRRYLPVLAAIEAEYRDRGVAFLALDVDPSETVTQMAALQVDSGAAFPFVRDIDGHCVAALGLQRTPEVVVLDSERTIRYRGRIDDQFRIGGSLPAAKSQPLRAALEQVLAGQPVTMPETPVDGCLITQPAAAVAAGNVPRYSKDVAPIVRRECQRCHRPGDVAPFTLSNHAELQAQSAMIREVVADRRMPPWYGADSSVPFKNHRVLSEADRSTLLAWIAAGCPNDAPGAAEPAPEPAPRWAMGEPDKVLTMLEEHEVPATGLVPYIYAVLPHVFAEDTWVSAIEISPDHPEVVHHANLGFAQLGEKVTDDNFLTGRVPGGDPMTLPEGTAVLIPRGSVIGLQIHYTTTGTPVTSKLSVGLKFPKSPVQKRLYFETISNRRFNIPPHAPAHEVRAERKIDHDAIGIGMFAHMHVRGRDMSFIAHLPDGRDQRMLLIPHYNFDWQQSYQWEEGAARFPAGTRFEVVAHYDNSKFNPFNPDPSATVRHGLQTEDEMMYGFVFYTRANEQLNLRVDPLTGCAVGP
jgi:thiol-disulfide isomerase/thioredoxin